MVVVAAVLELVWVMVVCPWRARRTFCGDTFVSLRDCTGSAVEKEAVYAVICDRWSIIAVIVTLQPCSNNPFHCPSLTRSPNIHALTSLIPRRPVTIHCVGAWARLLDVLKSFEHRSISGSSDYKIGGSSAGGSPGVRAYVLHSCNSMPAEMARSFLALVPEVR